MDARLEASYYQQGGSILNQAAHDAMQAGVESINAILGQQYDTEAGGVTLEYPY